MQTRQKRRILPDTMIQEIGRSVKCQKLNKFINRTPKLSVNKPKARRGDQFPGDPRWLSGHAGTFYPLIVLPRRNLTLRQTHLTSRDCQGIAPRRGAPLKCGRNLRFPHKRPLPKMPPAGGSVSPTGRKFLQIRAARHTATIHSSLFSIHWSRQGGISRPGIPRPTSRERQRIAPRRGATLKCGRNLRFPHKRPLPKRGAGVCG